MWGMFDVPLPILGRRVAGTDTMTNLRHGVWTIFRHFLHTAQRLLQCFRNVIPKCLERRNVKDVSFFLQVVRHRRTYQSVNGTCKRGKSLSRTSRRSK